MYKTARRLSHRPQGNYYQNQGCIHKILAARAAFKLVAASLEARGAFKIVAANLEARAAFKIIAASLETTS